MLTKESKYLIKEINKIKFIPKITSNKIFISLFDKVYKNYNMTSQNITYKFEKLDNKNGEDLGIIKIFKYIKNDDNLLSNIFSEHNYNENEKEETNSFLDNIKNDYINDYKKISSLYNYLGEKLSFSIYNLLLNKFFNDEIHQQCKNTNLFGKFTSINIHQKIETKMLYRYDITGNNGLCNLKLNLYNNKKCKINNIFYDYIFFLSKFLNNKDDIILDIWLTKQKKMIPEKNKFQYLGSDEVNSACCSFNPKMISLWRKEEIMKVCLHELCHFYMLEHQDDKIHLENYIYSHFDIKRTNKILIQESITEIYANLLNTILISIIYPNQKIKSIKFSKKNKRKKSKKSKKSKKNSNSFIKYLNIERNFCLFQAAKILNFYNYSKFSDFYKESNINEEDKSSKFLQKSSIFSYFILRSILFFSIDKYVELMNKYNNNNILENKIPINELIKLIEETLNNTNYQKIIDKLIIKNKNCKNNFFKNTLRYSCLELSIID